MKKMLVALLAICIAFSSISFVVFAEEETGDAAATVETKAVDSLVGAFYLQGTSGNALYAGDTTYVSDYNYTITDVLSKALKGTSRIPFYAFDKDSEVQFEVYAEDYFISETNAAKAAGIDFFAYKYYSGYTKDSLLINNMNRQLIQHIGKYSIADFESKLEYCIVLDGDFNAAKSKEVNAIVDDCLVKVGYLTAEDGRPVVFIEWNDQIDTQIKKLNTRLKKVVADGANPKKPSAFKTALNDDVEAMYVVALNAPSLAAAVEKGADSISWTQGAGKNGEAYTNMTATVEAKWASESANVVPNIVTGYDMTLLASNPIEVIAKKYQTDKETSVRYSRKGAADDYVAVATPEELVAHAKKAVETTNKPEKFSAVMFYAWDDFMGGAFLAPTKTDKAFQYNTDYIKALRGYFYGKTDGMPVLKVLDNENNVVVTDAEAKTITTFKKSEVVSKVDFDGKDLLAPAEPDTGDTNTDTNITDDTEKTDTNEFDPTIFIIIGAAAAVVIIAVVVVVVIVSKKKKK